MKREELGGEREDVMIHLLCDTATVALLSSDATSSVESARSSLSAR